MNFYKQIIPHRPEEGLYGDCYRTAIGCLLDIPPMAVPHFCDHIEDDEENDWVDRRDTWLAERGLRMVSIYLTNPTIPDSDGLTGLSSLLAYMGHINPGLYYLLGGSTIDDIYHAVICMGNQIIHNPGEARIVKPASETEHYEFSFLVPISMDAGVDNGGKSTLQRYWPRPQYLNFAMEMEQKSVQYHRQGMDPLVRSPLSLLRAMTASFNAVLGSILRGEGYDRNQETIAHLAVISTALVDGIKIEYGIRENIHKITDPEMKRIHLQEIVSVPPDYDSPYDPVVMSLTLDEAMSIIRQRKINKEAQTLIEQDRGYAFNKIRGMTP